MSKIQLCPCAFSRGNRVRFFSSKSMTIKFTDFLLQQFHFEMFKTTKPPITKHFSLVTFISTQRTIWKGTFTFFSFKELKQKLPYRNTVDFTDCIILYGFPLNSISCNIWGFSSWLNILLTVASSFSWQLRHRFLVIGVKITLNKFW